MLQLNVLTSCVFLAAGMLRGDLRSSSGTPDYAESVGVQAVAPAPPVAKSACSLLRSQRIAALLHLQVSEGVAMQGGRNKGECHWITSGAASGDVPAVGAQFETRELFNAWKAQEPKDQSFRSVPGLGSDAMSFYAYDHSHRSSGYILHVLKGDTAFFIQLPIFQMDAAKEARLAPIAKSLALDALATLP